MEDNKYYVPDITEFHIGYQYEFRPWDWKNEKFLDMWKPMQYKLHWSLHKILDKYIKTGNLRVKHLTKEDIESEGWILDCRLTELTYRYEKEKLGLLFNTENRRVRIWQLGENTLYLDALIPSVNELRKIIGLLNV